MHSIPIAKITVVLSPRNFRGIGLQATLSGITMRSILPPALRSATRRSYSALVPKRRAKRSAAVHAHAERQEVVFLGGLSGMWRLDHMQSSWLVVIGGRHPIRFSPLSR